MAGLPNPSLALPAIVVLGLLEPARADIATDGSVGPRMDVSGPEFTIPADLGRQAGDNLFHSFERFSLATGERATFSGPDRIENVISRVTGGEASEIDGTLRSTIPGADFYFINPAGVLFGPNASLDLQGSFHVSTADEVRFRDGAKFSADLAAGSSFTVAAPEAFGFLGSSLAPIRVDRSRLEVQTGQELSLVAGDVEIQGDPEAENAGGPGTVRSEAGVITLEALGSVSLTDHALVSTSGNGGGAIHIRGDNLVMDGQSHAAAENRGVSDSLGGLFIEAHRVQVTGGSVLVADAHGSGAGGDVVVLADALEISNQTRLTADTHGVGSAGRVGVTARDIAVRSEAIVSSSTFSEGDAGLVSVTAADHLNISASGEISSSTFGQGEAGGVFVAAEVMKIHNGGRITSSTFGRGDAGTVNVVAEVMEIHNGGRITSSTSAAGRGGSVRVEAGQLAVRGAVISSSARGNGVAGMVSLLARSLKADRSLIIARSLTSSAGRVRISIQGVADFRDSNISTFTLGPNAGDILIDADILILDGVRVITDAARRSGDLSLTAFGGLLGSVDTVLSVGPGTIITGRDLTELLDNNLILAGLVIPEEPDLAAAEQLRERCGARRDVGASSFTNVGRGGLPARPDVPLRSAYRSASSEASADAGSESAASSGARGAMLHPAGCAGAP